MKTILKIAKWELFRLRQASKLFAILILTSVIGGFFYATLLLYLPSALLIPFWFSNMTFFMLILIPILTSTMLNQNDMPLLKSLPVLGWEVIGGKFVATLGVLGLILLQFIPLLLGIAIPTDALGILGACSIYFFAIGAIFSAIGFWVSALTRHVITALGITVLVAIFLWQWAVFVAYVPSNIGEILGFFSIQKQAQNLLEGLVTFKNIGFFIVGTYGALWAAKVATFPKETTSFKHRIMWLLVGVGLLIVPGQRDWSGLRQDQLSEKTKWVLSQLKEPLTITLYNIPSTEGHQQLHRLLLMYQNENQKLKIVEKNNLEINPSLHIYNAQIDQKIDLKSLSFITEDPPQEWGITETVMTGQLAKLITTPKSILWVVGHGEMQSGSEDHQAGLLLNALKQEGVEVRVATLAGELSTVDLIILANPKTALTQSEINKLEGFLKNNGKVLVLQDPEFSKATERFLEPKGLKISPILIKEETRSQFLSQYSIVPSFDLATPEGKFLEKSNAWTFFGASAITYTDPFVSAWLFSSKNAWADQDGPFALGVTHHNLILITDSDWVSNAAFYKAQNRDGSLNLIAYSLNEPAVIRPRVKTLERLTISGVKVGMVYLWILGIPMLWSALWLLQSWRRRKK